MSDGSIEPSEVHVRRRVAMPRERVWALWTTAGGLEQWWWPMFDDTRYEVDAQVDGGFRIATAEGGIGVSGRYLEVEAPRRLVHSWLWHGGDEEGPQRVQTVIVAFAEAEDGAATDIEVRQAAPIDEIGPLTEGWEDCLTRLEELDDEA